MAGAHAFLLDDPWQVRAADFPVAGAERDKLLFLVNFAVLAPSILNTQPWLFHVGDGRLRLRADRACVLPVVDPEGREMVISCGAALLNLRVAASGFGLAAEASILPAAGDPDLLAELRLAGAAPASEEDRRLRDAILARRTNRRRFADRPLAPELLDAMAKAAAQEGAEVTFLEDPGGKRKVAALTAEAERLHLADPAFRQELADWIRRDRLGEAACGESLWRTGAAGRTPESAIAKDRTTIRAADLAREFATAETATAQQYALVEGSPCLALLTSRDDTVASWIAAGQAMQRVLLRATLGGVASSFLNPPIELPQLRPRVAKAFGARGMAQVLLRFGYAPETPPAPRRAAARAVVDQG